MRDPNTYEETERIIASENYRKIVKSLKINLLQVLKNNWDIFQVCRNFLQ